MKTNTIEVYETYASKIGNREGLYSLVANEYQIKSAIYPGSHVDIAVSMVVPKVIYIDNFKGAIQFFGDMETIHEYVNQRKKYDGACEIEFIGLDYTSELNIDKVDLIISQYAGFVGQETKQYLKRGGILLCNDSHGDASLAYGDEDFELIGIINDDHEIETENLDSYFKLSKDKVLDFDWVRDKMKGLKYTKMASNYVFKYNRI